MYAKSICAVFLLLLTVLTGAAELKFYTEEYPPVTFSRDGKATGLGTEVVEELLRRQGISAEIEVLPWSRAYSLALVMPKVGLFVTTRTPEREKLFKWVGPVSATTAHFYFLQGSTRVDSLEQARKVDRILVPRGWYLQQTLQNMGFTNIHGVTKPVDAVRILMAGRAPLMALDDVTLNDTLASAKVDGQPIVRGLTLVQAVQYIAFWREAPDELIQSWQKSLDEMKADGSFARIYAKWLPNALPPGSVAAHLPGAEASTAPVEPAVTPPVRQRY